MVNVQLAGLDAVWHHISRIDCTFFSVFIPLLRMKLKPKPLPPSLFSNPTSI
jgi:hypothetical protein